MFVLILKKMLEDQERQANPAGQLEAQRGESSVSQTTSVVSNEPKAVIDGKEVDLATAVRLYQEQNGKFKLLIGTPCYGGQLFTGYFQSILETAVNLTKLGVDFEVLNIGNESLIPRARNGIVAKFLGNPEYTHLMFIDADITFPWISIVKLLLSGKDVSGGCYPKKNINWEKVKKNVGLHPNANFKELIARSVDYVFNPVYYQQPDGKLIAKIDGGLVQVKDVATGFMMIKREFQLF